MFKIIVFNGEWVDGFMAKNFRLNRDTKEFIVYGVHGYAGNNITHNLEEEHIVDIVIDGTLYYEAI